MWVCPKCNHKFFNINQSHSCGNYTVEDFIKDKTVIDSLRRTIYEIAYDPYSQIIYNIWQPE